MDAPQRILLSKNFAAGEANTRAAAIRQLNRLRRLFYLGPDNVRAPVTNHAEYEYERD